MNKSVILLVALVPLLFAGKMWTLDEALDQAPVRLVQGDHQFIGATRCRTCHRKEEDGAQYEIWSNERHSKAFETLATDQAKQVAAAKGIADPQTAEACLRCHVTGYDAPAALLGDKYDKAEGVSCESCHGAGGDYYKKSTMEGITKGEIDGASVGLVEPTEALCVTCHNAESPTFKGFDFEEASKKIAHPIPAAKMAEYQ